MCNKCRLLCLYSTIPCQTEIAPLKTHNFGWEGLYCPVKKTPLLLFKNDQISVFWLWFCKISSEKKTHEENRLLLVWDLILLILYTSVHNTILSFSLLLEERTIFWHQFFFFPLLSWPSELFAHWVKPEYSCPHLVGCFKWGMCWWLDLKEERS